MFLHDCVGGIGPGDGDSELVQWVHKSAAIPSIFQELVVALINGRKVRFTFRLSITDMCSYLNRFALYSMLSLVTTVSS